MQIDSHVHLWAPARGDYFWLTPDLEPLYDDFTPSDLEPLLTAASIDGVVLVQAAPTIAETEFMLGIAHAWSRVLGVVGWVDMDDPGCVDDIGRLAQMRKLKAIRPMIQDIADDDWMLGDHLRAAFTAVMTQDLTFDFLVKPRHLRNTMTVLRRHPDLRVIIDHGAKPNIAGQAFDTWAADMTAIARDTSAYVKLSGLVTESAADWTTDHLRPYVDLLLSEFGSQRILWGSDWPVVTLASDYARWRDTTMELVSDLSADERARILGGTAVEAYRLQLEN